MNQNFIFIIFLRKAGMQMSYSSVPPSVILITMEESEDSSSTQVFFVYGLLLSTSIEYLMKSKMKLEKEEQPSLL